MKHSWNGIVITGGPFFELIAYLHNHNGWHWFCIIAVGHWSLCMTEVS